MKAVRLHRYGEDPRVEEVAKPKITGPHDVLVRIGGVGVCRTDLRTQAIWRNRRGSEHPKRYAMTRLLAFMRLSGCVDLIMPHVERRRAYLSIVCPL